MSFRCCIVAIVLASLSGCGMPSLLITPVYNAGRMEEIEVQPGQGLSAPKIAIIEIEGMLINARSDGLLGPGENKLSLFTQELEIAENDSSVKAVVLRINSPGGTVVCSDTMYQLLQRFKARTHKPVISSTQEVAASGAFYLACASDKIVASPTSIVGSIGVIFESFNVTGTMQKLGVTSDAIKSGPHKDMGSPFKSLTDADAASDREIMQQLVREYYARFVDIVKTNRKLPDEGLASITDGRVFSGEQALKLHLVDQLGLLSDAIDLAKQLSDSPKASVVMYRRPAGYSGSIYADTSTPTPQANVLQLPLPPTATLPRGFYYLWE